MHWSAFWSLNESTSLLCRLARLCLRYRANLKRGSFFGLQCNLIFQVFLFVLAAVRALIIVISNAYSDTFGRGICGLDVQLLDG